MAPKRFSFSFDTPYRLAARPFGVTPQNSYIEIDDDRFTARFGPWLVATARDNVRGASVTGPYSFLKTAGPAHLSAADRGLTFASNGRSGACISFRHPVHGIDFLGLVRHPSLTVTVQDPEAFADLLTTGPVVHTDLDHLSDLTDQPTT